MRYLLAIACLIWTTAGYSQIPSGKSSEDSLVRKLVDSTVRVKLDSIKKANKGILDYLEENKIEIRKGFSATTKDDQQPASVFWSKDFLTKFAYTSVDLAVRRKDWQLIKNPDKAEFYVSPKIEWHKNADTTDENKNNKNSLSGGVNFEYYYTLNKWTPFATASVDYKHDFKNKNETVDLTAYVSVLTSIKPLPGSQIRWGKKWRNDLAFRYYIYSGIEYYKRTDSSSQSSAYWASKLSFEFNPIPQYLEFTFEYTYRVKANDSFYKLGDLYWLSIGVNHYFDARRRIGVGVGYSLGNDPNNSFIKTKKIDIGFKFKI